MSYTRYNTVETLDFTKLLNDVDISGFDHKLYSDLLNIYSPSKGEALMFNYIWDYVEKNFPNVLIEHDDKFNIYITKGEIGKDQYYPCIVAHIDEVHRMVEGERKIMFSDNIYFGFSAKKGGTIGIGADDKNGIYCALKLLSILPKVKVVFTVEEECGLIGANQVELDFFEDCGYMLEADRKGHSDLIYQTNGKQVASEELMTLLKPITTTFGYSNAVGTATDIGVIAPKCEISAFNISCGYWNAHTSSEITYVPSLQNCLDYMVEICNAAGLKRYEYKYVAPKYNAPYSGLYDNAYSGGYGRGYGYGTNSTINPTSKVVTKTDATSTVQPSKMIVTGGKLMPEGESDDQYPRKKKTKTKTKGSKRSKKIVFSDASTEKERWDVVNNNLPCGVCDENCFNCPHENDFMW